MKKIIYILLTAFSLMVIINLMAPAPTLQHLDNSCTRYCHNVNCPHFQQNFKQYEHTLPMANTLRTLYSSNIQALKQNGLGMSYKQVNLFIYVFGFPLITIALAWGAFRKVG